MQNVVYNIIIIQITKKTLPTTGLNLRVSFVSMDSHPLGDDVMISNFAVVYHPSSSLSFSSNNIVCCNCLFLNYSAKKKTPGHIRRRIVKLYIFKKHTQTLLSFHPFLSSLLRLLNKKKNCKSFFSFFFYATLFFVLCV